MILLRLSRIKGNVFKGEKVMGYVKYNEDNIKINDNRDLNYDKLKLHRQEQKTIFHCPYCDEPFFAKDAMFEHIRKSHYLTTPIVLVNGSIPNGHEMFITKVESVLVYNYGFNFRVTVNGNVITNTDDEIDITSEVKMELDNSNTVVIKIDKTEFVLNTYSIDKLRYELINPIIDRWENEAFNGNTNLNKVDNNLFNPSEINYLDAFFNYYIACASQDDVIKKERYDDAFNLLNEFRKLDGKANCVLKVISLRRNWINKLEMLNDYDDDFSVVYDFFVDEEIDSHRTTNQENGQLLIEQELVDFINAVKALNMNKLDEVKKYIDEFNTGKMENKNHRNKILLLKAKYYQNIGDMKRFENLLNILNRETYFTFKINDRGGLTR